MLKTFRPEFSGAYSPEQLRPDFIAALAGRVRTGLFPLASKRRNRHLVASQSPDRLRFRSQGLLTAITIGWNDVRVQIDLVPASPGEPPKIHYHVLYFGWARYCVVLCAFVGVALIAAWFLFGERYGARQSVAKTIFWVMTIFWGFVWPWILVALHKRPAAGALERLFAKVNAAEF